jgi:hypothetical protein
MTALRSRGAGLRPDFRPNRAAGEKALSEPFKRSVILRSESQGPVRCKRATGPRSSREARRRSPPFCAIRRSGEHRARRASQGKNPSQLRTSIDALRNAAPREVGSDLPPERCAGCELSSLRLEMLLQRLAPSRTASIGPHGAVKPQNKRQQEPEDACHPTRHRLFRRLGRLQIAVERHKLVMNDSEFKPSRARCSPAFGFAADANRD